MSSSGTDTRPPPDPQSRTPLNLTVPANGIELPGGWRVIPELAAGGMWSTPTDLAKLLLAISRAFRGDDNRLLDREMIRAMLTPLDPGPYGFGGALGGSGRGLVLMKRGQNMGYQGYMLI